MAGIVPRKIKGFRDIDQEISQLRWSIINAATKVYKSYGFDHWDTPVLEYAECLGKYMPDSDTVDQGVYSFKNPEAEPVLLPNGEEKRDEANNVLMDKQFLALRYDLTSPLSRLCAENLWQNSIKGIVNENNVPLFRRYQFGQVYRFETKLDPGRFREFWQLDFDSVGTKDVAADAEVCMILCEALEAIGLQRGSYLLKINNRKVLKGFISGVGIDNEEIEQNIFRIIDKSDKIGIKGIEQELGTGRQDASGAKIEGLNLNKDLIIRIMDFYNQFVVQNKRNITLLNLKATGINTPAFTEGLEELEKINSILTNLGFEEDRIVFDPTLVRGMAYYTGPVFEVESTQSYKDEKGRDRKMGAICGGGRYDGLVERLLGIKVPATGASIGVDRLAELLTLTGRATKKIIGPIFIAVFDENLMNEYQKIAFDLRKAGMSAEVYYGSQKGLKKQLAYADKKNCPVAILIGEDEVKKGVASVRNLKLGGEMSKNITNKDEWKDKVQFEVQLSELTSKVQEILNSQ